MRLEKWYADVTDGDSVFIYYGASLDVGPLSVAYEGALQGGHKRCGSFWLGRNGRMPTKIDCGNGDACLEAPQQAASRSGAMRSIARVSCGRMDGAM